jgi:hypothetical protein
MAKDVPLGEMTSRKLTVWSLLGYGGKPKPSSAVAR